MIGVTWSMPDPPRYEARRHDGLWGIFDTFTQEFLDGEDFPILLEAVQAAGVRNRIYSNIEE